MKICSLTAVVAALLASAHSYWLSASTPAPSSNNASVAAQGGNAKPATPPLLCFHYQGDTFFEQKPGETEEQFAANVGEWSARKQFEVQRLQGRRAYLLGLHREFTNLVNETMGKLAIARNDERGLYQQALSRWRMRVLQVESQLNKDANSVGAPSTAPAVPSSFAPAHQPVVPSVPPTFAPPAPIRAIAV